MSDRTTLRLSDERKRLLNRAERIVAADEADDPPRSDVIDAALTHLIQTHENLEEARGDVEPETIQQLLNTDVMGLRYRTRVEHRWR